MSFVQVFYDTNTRQFWTFTLPPYPGAITVAEPIDLSGCKFSHSNQTSSAETIGESIDRMEVTAISAIKGSAVFPSHIDYPSPQFNQSDIQALRDDMLRLGSEYVRFKEDVEKRVKNAEDMSARADNSKAEDIKKALEEMRGIAERGFNSLTEALQRTLQRVDSLESMRELLREMDTPPKLIQSVIKEDSKKL